jgi:hypothetical protein
MVAAEQASMAARPFPPVECCFQSDIGEWRGHWSPHDGEGDSEPRNLRNLSREFLVEAANERFKEAAVFALIVVTSAWPVIYMIVTVVKLLGKEPPP